MDIMEWNDGRRSGGRYPDLAFVKRGKIRPFLGKSIPGVAVVTSKRSKKAGKWSNTTYQLKLSSDVGVWDVINPLHGSVFENASVWDEAHAIFVRVTSKYVDMSIFKNYMYEYYPNTSERFDTVEKELKDLEIDSILDTKIEYSFGNPCLREMNRGYWSSPKESPFGILSLPPGEDWISVKKQDIMTPNGVIILDTRYRRGRHRGYVTLTMSRLR